MHTPMLDEMDIQIIIDALEKEQKQQRFYFAYYPLLIGKLKTIKRMREQEILKRLEGVK